MLAGMPHLGAKLSSPLPWLGFSMWLLHSPTTLVSIETNTSYSKQLFYCQSAILHGKACPLRPHSPRRAGTLRKGKHHCQRHLSSIYRDRTLPAGRVESFPKRAHHTYEHCYKAYDNFLHDDKMKGQTVELGLDQLYFRDLPEYANDSERWLSQEVLKVWERAYK